MARDRRSNFILFYCRNEGVEDSIVPFFCTQFYPASQWTWNYTTVPQVGLNNRTVPYPRGRLLGGSSSVSECLCRAAVDVWRSTAFRLNFSGFRFHGVYPRIGRRLESVR